MRVGVDPHAYQLYLAVENIGHSRAKVRHPQTNGICECIHKTMKQEFYDIAFRKLDCDFYILS
jgi:transposase InsO family protein